MDAVVVTLSLIGNYETHIVHDLDVSVLERDELARLRVLLGMVECPEDFGVRVARVPLADRVVESDREAVGFSVAPFAINDRPSPRVAGLLFDSVVPGGGSVYA